MTDSSTHATEHGTPPRYDAARAPLAGGGATLREGVPPSSNTGAENTHPPFQRRALIDYAALTLPDGIDPQAVPQLLGLNPHDVRQLDRGVNGYRQGAAYGHTRVYWEGNAGMGVHVIISGEACRELEQATGPGYWKQQYHVVKDLGGHYTRVDVAIDDTTGALDLAHIESAPVRSYWKASQAIRSRSLIDDSSRGTTVYFGSRQSNAMARFYDKAEEQGVAYPWVRVELELKRDHANAVMQLVALDAPVGSLVTGILRHYLTFIEPNPNDSNRSRWPAAAWWESWLGDVERLKLTSGERKVSTVEEMAAHVERQYGPTLATLRRALGHRWESWLRHVDRTGAARMKDRHHEALQLAQRAA